MNRSLLWVVICILFIGGGYAAGYYSHDYVYDLVRGYSLSATNLNGNQYPDAVASPGSTPPSALPPAQAQTQTAVQLGPYKVMSISPTSVTVQTSYGKSSTYALTSDTKIYSVVAPGVTGKGLSDITSGMYILVSTVPSRPTIAVALAFYRAPEVQLTPENINNSLAGTITALSGSSVTITPQDKTVAPVTIMLDTSTQIINQVAAGQVGKSLAVGMYVVANGIQNTGSGVTATILTIPLSAPAQK